MLYYTDDNDFLHIGEYRHHCENEMTAPLRHLNPHYSDTYWNKPHDIFLREGYRLTQSAFGAHVEGAHYEYSDRLWQWDYDKCDAAFAAAKEVASSGTAAYFEKMLQAYHEDPDLLLVNIKAGVNLSNGYAYQVFGFISGKK